MASSAPSVLNLVDVAGVPRPRAAEAGGGKGGVAAGGRGGALSGRGRGRGGGGADGAGTPLSRPSSVSSTRCRIPAQAMRAVPRFQADAADRAVPVRWRCACPSCTCAWIATRPRPSSLVPKLRILSTLVQAGGVVRPTAASGARTGRAKGGWWSPSEELQATEETVEGLAASLGMSRSDLISSAIELDHTSSDELLALQKLSSDRKG